MMDVLKESCGKQDQYAAAFGNLIHLDINKNQRVTVTPINISYESLKLLEKNLMMFYTGYVRSANEILSEQSKKAEKNEDIFSYYHEIKKIGKESLKCLEKGDLRRFGEWMNIHWELKRKIGKSMTNHKIDEWYSLALANGAIGGKIIGAGGGGFLLFYVDSNHDKIKLAMEKEGLVYTPFKFDFDGSRIVYNGEYF
jgi:D-glycero-alpha-D-manno-heptose-7-phosphate kinase